MNEDGGQDLAHLESAGYSLNLLLKKSFSWLILAPKTNVLS